MDCATVVTAGNAFQSNARGSDDAWLDVSNVYAADADVASNDGLNANAHAKCASA